jgi:hypothetical protein
MAVTSTWRTRAWSPARRLGSLSPKHAPAATLNLSLATSAPGCCAGRWLVICVVWLTSIASVRTQMRALRRVPERNASPFCLTAAAGTELAGTSF